MSGERLLMRDGPPEPNSRNQGCRRFLRGAGVLGLALLATLACNGGEGERPLTTLDRTIGLDEKGNLVWAAGEPYVVRTELSQAQAGREQTRRSLLTFHHFADFRLIDEESPLRSEWVEACEPPLSTNAFRPHEALSVHAAAALVRQANQIRESPLTGRPVDFVLHTGSAADNAQYNELRWFIDMLDGRPLNPDSGEPGYHGVQDGAPAEAYPDLLARAQQPFRPEGLQFPWYAAAGNRDLLAQGSIPPNDSLRAIATGAEKLISVGSAALEEICADAPALLVPGASERLLSDPETAVRTVPPARERRLLSRSDWISEHFRTERAPGPVGHGLPEAPPEERTAYYALDFGRVSLIVLDTVNSGGFSSGSIDEKQFRWLQEQLIARSSRYLDESGRLLSTENEDRLIIVASHHPAGLMNNPFPGAAGSGERYRGPQFQELLHRFPNVVLHLAGHTMAHRITPRTRAGVPAGAYWEATTASPLDFPMQGRLIDIVDNGDGTLSIFTTVYDNAAPLKPGDAQDPTPGDGVNELLLAAVARQIALRDPHRDPDASGRAPSDRNAELILAAPFPLSDTAR